MRVNGIGPGLIQTVLREYYRKGADRTEKLIRQQPYNQDGYMAGSLMRADRGNFKSPDIRAATPEEKLAAFDSYSSYCGTYEVKLDKIIHHVELSLFPNWSGGDQERYFEFAGNQLALRTPHSTVGGVERTAILIWQRVNS